MQKGLICISPPPLSSFSSFPPHYHQLLPPASFLPTLLHSNYSSSFFLSLTTQPSTTTNRPTDPKKFVNFSPPLTDFFSTAKKRWELLLAGLRCMLSLPFIFPLRSSFLVVVIAHTLMTLPRSSSSACRYVRKRGASPTRRSALGIRKDM